MLWNLMWSFVVEVADNVETCVAGFYMSSLSFEGYF
jgi:hypothetical protein